MNFGLGAAPPEAYIQIAPGKKFVVRLNGHSDLRRVSLGSRNLAPYGGICVLLANALLIPPYGSMGGYLVYCVFVFLFVYMVINFSAAEKDSGAKLRMLV